MPTLDGQVAIVTGASRGIGADIARVLAREGAKVVVAARTLREGDFHIPGSIEETVADINRSGGVATGVKCDLSRDEDMGNLVRATVDAYGRVDILVNNAAIAVPGTIMTMSPRHLDLSWRLNVWAPVMLSREVIPSMTERGSGAIINISSGASRGPGPGPYAQPGKGGTPYGLTKAALERFTQGLAHELAGSGISVNALSPARQIFVGGTVYVTRTNPAFAVSDLTGKRKDGTIMGDACVAMIQPTIRS
jgi:NAD(P)-dependent dehydrogenase (short-subunit alcohol dehydrogenase family)